MGFNLLLLEMWLEQCCYNLLRIIELKVLIGRGVTLSALSRTALGVIILLSFGALCFVSCFLGILNGKWGFKLSKWLGQPPRGGGAGRALAQKQTEPTLESFLQEPGHGSPREPVLRGIQASKVLQGCQSRSCRVPVRKEE